MTVTKVPTSLIDTVDGSQITGQIANSVLRDDIPVSKISGLGAIGARNFLINGGFIVNQRGNTTSMPAVPTYIADRWTFQVSGGTGMSGTAGASLVTGMASGVGGGFFSASWTSGMPSFVQRVEAAVCRRLNGKTVTISGKLYHTLGSTRTVVVYLFKANALDDFSSSTMVGSFPFTAGAGLTSFSGQVTLGATDASNGLQVIIQDNAASTVTGVQYYIGDVQMEEGNLPTPFDARPFPLELALCMRYYEKSYDYATAPGTAAAPNGVSFGHRANGGSTLAPRYAVPKRVAVTPVVYSPVTGASAKLRNYNAVADDNPTIGFAGTAGFNVAPASASINDLLGCHWAVSAEL